MSEDEIIKAGISALRTGDKTRAKSLFSQLVKENPSSEQGWYLLGRSVTSLEQREYCYKRVLTINPNNQDAKKQLALLVKQEPSLDWLSQLETNQTQEESKLVPIDSSRTVEKKQQNKNSNKIVVFAMAGTLFFGICIFSLAFVLFPQTFRQLLSPVVPNQNPVLAPTQTLGPLVLTTETPIPPTAIPSALPTVAYFPRYEETPCSFETPSDVKVTCGYVIVPEDRSGDPSKTIRLAVAVFHSTSQNPAPDPVMFLQGGPGREIVGYMAMDPAYHVLVVPFLADRDFIVFDQRGTGLSKPALKCDELSNFYSQDMHGLIPEATRELIYSNAFLSCSALMNAQGVNLNAYTTVASAADLKDILDLLGYEKVNLFGVSYGTRLAQVVMRDYPQIVRATILDSVVPVDKNLFLDYQNGLEFSLRALFDTCLADPQCNVAYPDLERVFRDLVIKLDVSPVTITTSGDLSGLVTQTIDGSIFTRIVLGSVNVSSLIKSAPQSIYRVRNGDYSTLIAAQRSIPYAYDGINAGLYISMMCHEHILAATVEELQAIPTSDMEGYDWFPFYGGPNDIVNTCKSWKVVGPYTSENDAAIGSLPSLIFAGQFDVQTPSIYAREVASQLTNSYYFEFPNLGHSSSGNDPSGCAIKTALAFLNTPTIEPDRTCLNEITQIDFLTPYNGSPSLPFKGINISGVSVKIPEDWQYQPEGLFIRQNSLLDLTQVGIYQSQGSAAELMASFSLKVRGYGGLDIAPEEVGSRGEWILYTSTEDGLPVDLAVADLQGKSVLLVMLSHPDEHDALYRTVFLPMVDSAR